eukprot:6612807-Pyramimonas_sp.AAC.1
MASQHDSATATSEKDGMGIMMCCDTMSDRGGGLGLGFAPTVAAYSETSPSLQMLRAVSPRE